MMHIHTQKHHPKKLKTRNPMSTHKSHSCAKLSTHTRKTIINNQYL
jgi:hypothetical protein